MKKTLLTSILSMALLPLVAQNIANPTTNTSKITSGINNTLIGSNAGDSLTTGSGNSYLGNHAGFLGKEVNGNVAIGESAGLNNSEDFNIFIGNNAGENNEGKRNVIIGTSAASEKLEDNDNVFIGFEAGLSSDKAKRNVVIGSESGQDMDDGEDNVIIGSEAGKNTDASNNIFIGRESGKENVNGESNVFVGKSSGELNTDGERNTFLGYRAGLGGEGSASYNVAIGDSAGAVNMADGNVFIGTVSGATTVDGAENVFVGARSGAVGSDAATISNSVAIGNEAKVAINDAIILGDTTNLNLKVGIGTASPKHKLDVKGVVNMTVGFNSPAMKINDAQFVGIDEDGKFLMSDFKIKYSDKNEWSDKVFDKTYNLMPLSDLKVFIEENNHLPNVPSAEEVVNKGVGIYEITSKLLEKIEEQSLYILQLKEEVDALKASMK
ncbi:hypothetical protein [Arcticibacterium luteifluviistationis]|nr:hypothetical protein [Arcticibacterium luteifluviistationis]